MPRRNRNRRQIVVTPRPVTVFMPSPTETPVWDLPSDRYLSVTVDDLERRLDRGHTPFVVLTDPDSYTAWCTKNRVDSDDPDTLAGFADNRLGVGWWWRNVPADLAAIWETDMAVLAAAASADPTTAEATAAAVHQIQERLFNLVDDSAVVAVETCHPVTGRRLVATAGLHRTRRQVQADHPTPWRRVTNLLTLASYRTGAVTIRSVRDIKRNAFIQRWFLSRTTAQPFSLMAYWFVSPDGQQRFGAPDYDPESEHPDLVDAVDRTWATITAT